MTDIKVYPVHVCKHEAPIKQMKIEERAGGVNVIVYGRDLEATCPQCGKKFKDHK